ncbi:hypothetical protein [Actinomyces sp. ZJ308]|uniref:hypothetical protein n=1 Tax=Actinomyces sp. ZJ308 TaxID=2708342 RepID=UPI001FBA02D0|nr:hypothetical protein [Actinomyces sp. ZJ308]
MSRPLSRGPQFDDAEADETVDRAGHVDRGRPTERIDLAQAEAQTGATEAIAMPPGGEGWGYLPPSTSTPQLAASPDQRSQYTQVLQPMPAAPQTMAMPAQAVYPTEPAQQVQPVYVNPEPARPAASQVPVQQTWTEPEPEPERPVDLPRPPKRRRTAALPVGTIMVLVASGLLGWGTYTLLTTLHVFEIISSQTWTPNWTAIGAIGGGALLAFIAFFVACTALARAKPKAPAALLVLAALFLPAVATGAGIYYGAGVLKTQTMAEAENFAGQLNVGNIGDIDQVLSSLQSGVSFPGREDIISVLNTVKDKAAQQGVDVSGGADQSGDQQGGTQDGAGQGDGDVQQGDGQQDDGEQAGSEGE